MFISSHSRQKVQHYLSMAYNVELLRISEMNLFRIGPSVIQANSKLRSNPHATMFDRKNCDKINIKSLSIIYVVIMLNYIFMDILMFYFVILTPLIAKIMSSAMMLNNSTIFSLINNQQLILQSPQTKIRDIVAPEKSITVISKIPET